METTGARRGSSTCRRRRALSSSRKRPLRRSRRRVMANPPWPSGGLRSRCSGRGLALALAAEGLDDVTFLVVGEAFDAYAAFVASLHLAHVFLEAAQAIHPREVEDFFGTQDAGGGSTCNLAVADVAAGHLP